MYVIKNTATNNYYRKLGNQNHKYVSIEDATTFAKWKQAKQKADILHAAISPIGEQVNFKVEQHKFYMLKNKSGKGYFSPTDWHADRDKATLFASKDRALKEAQEATDSLKRVGIELNFEVKEI
jgi:uncharacterized FlgJ-related protein